MRIATFNVQNLRLRSHDGQRSLDAASDRDAPEPDATAALARADRRKTARVVANAYADIVALQEVFDIETLDYFHDRFLVSSGAGPYDYRYCLPGNDGHGLNVAALGRQKAKLVKSHADKTGADLGLTDLPPELRDHPIFRRDCLELHFGSVALFICHFKAPYPDPAKALEVRTAEARAVRRIIEARFANPELENWIILGDFNEPVPATSQAVSALDILRDGFAVDLLDQLDAGCDWTYEVPSTHIHTRPDRIFVSPALARDFPGSMPQIIRSGMDSMDSAAGYTDSNQPGRRARASDHALVFADFPGL